MLLGQRGGLFSDCPTTGVEVEQRRHCRRIDTPRRYPREFHAGPLESTREADDLTTKVGRPPDRIVGRTELERRTAGRRDGSGARRESFAASRVPHEQRPQGPALRQPRGDIISKFRRDEKAAVIARAHSASRIELDRYRDRRRADAIVPIRERAQRARRNSPPSSQHASRVDGRCRNRLPPRTHPRRGLEIRAVELACEVPPTRDEQIDARSVGEVDNARWLPRAHAAGPGSGGEPLTFIHDSDTNALNRSARSEAPGGRGRRPNLRMRLLSL